MVVDDEEEPTPIVAPFGTEGAPRRGGLEDILHGERQPEDYPDFAAPEDVPKEDPRKSGGRRRVLPPRRKYQPSAKCPKCGYDLERRVRQRAFRVIGSIGEAFAAGVDGDPIAAVKEFIRTTSLYLDILTDSGMCKFEAATKVIMEVTMLLSAPKGGEKVEDAVEMIRLFLNEASDVA